MDITNSRPTSRWPRSFAVLHSRRSTSSSERETWDRKVEFILSCIGYCVGFGNVWRFPYIVYKNGGAVFLIPYIIVVILVATPIFFLECILGQFSSCSPISAFNFAPAFRGIGAAMGFVSFFISLYYIVFMAYSIKFFYSSFRSELPWSVCDASWGAGANCLPTASVQNVTCPEDYKNASACPTWESSSVQYWKRAVLHIEDPDGYSYSLSDLGSVQLELLLCLALAWFILYMCIARGIKSSGKVVYFTAVFPYFVLIAWVGFTVPLEGAFSGLYYLYTPKWAELFSLTIWRESVIQAFYSSSIGLGGLIFYSSYNEFEHKLYWNVILVITMDILASVLSSTAVFSVLGFLAHQLGVEVENVLDKGPGLIFVVIPNAISMMPIPQFCSVIFFLMLFTIGVDSESVLADVFITVLYDEIPVLRGHPMKIRACLCFLCFLLSIPFTLNGGLLLVDFLDQFAADATLIWNTLTEVVAISYVYGITRFLLDIEFMLGYQLSWFWRICWLFIDPVVLMILFVFGIYQLVQCPHFSIGFCLGGFAISLFIILQVPIWAMYYFWKYQKTEGDWKKALKPAPEWGPRDIVRKIIYLDWRQLHGSVFGERTTTTLNQLHEETERVEGHDLKSVIRERLRERRLSVLRTMSTKFDDEEMEKLEQELRVPS